MLAAAGHAGRHPQRDQAMILLAYRHGLRVSELVALRWEHIDLKAGVMHVRRLKGGSNSVHPIRGPEIGVFCISPRKGIFQAQMHCIDS